jgi:cysteine-rich repeat protein
VNTVVGFIGPEYLEDGPQITRAGLEDHFMGKLLGLPMGCDACFTYHASMGQDELESLKVLLGAAGCTYLMSLPVGDDIMLNYQSTSFHDIPSRAQAARQAPDARVRRVAGRGRHHDRARQPHARPELRGRPRAEVGTGPRAPRVTVCQCGGGKQGPAWRRRGAGVALVISAALAGACLEPGHVTCSDGALCPAGWTCLATGCVSPAQIAACDGLGDGDACTFAGVEGACRDGGCFDARCGDGQLGADEVCDDGNRIDGDGCSADCASDETCGNAVRDQAEACDLGADNSADPDAACRPDCTRPGCGDGVVDPSGGEACDDGAANDLAPDAACRPNCQPRRCSDGVTDPAAGEACDDGNLVPGDGCSFDCVSDETCGNGATDYLEGELCDDGNARPHDGCDRSCQPERATWSQVGVTPGARGYAATAFDLARGQLVMFGGRSAAGLLADTWVHADLDWRLVPTPNGAPPARQGAAAAFDSDRGVVVLFGGVADSGLLADTWEFDGAGWREVAVPAAHRRASSPRWPTTRSSDARCCTAAATRAGLLNDTWLFDGETWTDAAPFIGAGTRSHHGMAFRRGPGQGRGVGRLLRRGGHLDPGALPLSLRRQRLGDDERGRHAAFARLPGDGLRRTSRRTPHLRRRELANGDHACGRLGVQRHDLDPGDRVGPPGRRRGDGVRPDPRAQRHLRRAPNRRRHVGGHVRAWRRGPAGGLVRRHRAAAALPDERRVR